MSTTTGTSKVQEAVQSPGNQTGGHKRKPLEAFRIQLDLVKSKRNLFLFGSDIPSQLEVIKLVEAHATNSGFSVRRISLNDVGAAYAEKRGAAQYKEALANEDLVVIASCDAPAIYAGSAHQFLRFLASRQGKSTVITSSIPFSTLFQIMEHERSPLFNKAENPLSLFYQNAVEIALEDRQ